MCDEKPYKCNLLSSETGEVVGVIYGKTREEAGKVAKALSAIHGLISACNQVHEELDTITGGDANHPQANYVGHMKATLRNAVANTGVTY